MKDAPTQAWLVDVRYLEDKRSVTVEFSGLSGKKVLRLPFFPCFYVNKRDFSLECLKNSIGYDRRRFRVSDDGLSFKVAAATFRDLGEVAESLFRETGFRALVLEPERQFLFESCWSFFDCFTFFSEGEYVKSASFSVPKAKLGFFSEPLPETIALLVEESQESGERFAESVVLSNILGLGLQVLPDESFLRQEALFDKVFWRLGLSVSNAMVSSVRRVSFSAGFAARGGLAEVDFSLLWPMLLTKPLYNVGPDSLNCSCCKPVAVSESNFLPDSLVLVEFLQDGFFFDSGSGLFAQDFHVSNAGKERRLRRMNEFCLKQVPCGPFFRSQRAEVPLVDAVSLSRAGKARVVGFGHVSWFCLKRESLVSREICSLNGVISALESECELFESSFLRSHGVLGNAFLSRDIDFLFSKARLKLCRDFLCGLPRHLCDERSKFFDRRTCAAVEAVEAKVFDSFKEFASGYGSRVVAVSGEKAYVRSSRPYSLIRRFSEAEKVPGVLRARNRLVKQAF